MKKISGYVLLKETNSGIPNLIVTAYDCEKSLREIIGERPDQETFSLENLGKRIGSVLTDQNGRFILMSEDLEFQGIIIFAPEDVQDLKTPYPLPPEQRILYVSTVPREHVGAEESFVIRLLQNQLEHFHISTTTITNDRNMDDNRLATEIEEAWHFGDRLKDRLKPRLREEQKKSEEFQSKAQEKVRHLSAIPRYLRNDSLTNNKLLINGKRDIADNLKLKQDQAVANGLERLSTRNTVMHLRLTENELKDLGLKMKDGQIVGKIVSDKLTEKVRAKIKGLDLVRKRGMNNPSPEALIKKYLLNTPVPPNDKNDTYDE